MLFAPHVFAYATQGLVWVQYEDVQHLYDDDDGHHGEHECTVSKVTKKEGEAEHAEQQDIQNDKQ